ncbi:bifunctional phosphoribosyl-AMP cyclohydrolase/phosphoribosyl-ATP diphosphatase HisIE [Brumimicrobium oceani]|nr:bifunctional phosphoribosyl-AMP cyclohydrolase/phosphoribosyl-ATP diphosphatase HisIE [Brumimicrobium oceani]
MKIEFDKNNGIIPVIIQDVNTYDVLMFAYMNEEAYDITLRTKEVTFFSNEKQALWTKGKDKNALIFHGVELDEDERVLLMKVEPIQAIGEEGKMTVWGDTFSNQHGILEQLEKKINDRKLNPKDNSYISSLFDRGENHIAEKFGQEAIEMIVDLKNKDKELFSKESADLLLHYLVLLKSKGITLNDVLKTLKSNS